MGGEPTSAGFGRFSRGASPILKRFHEKPSSQDVEERAFLNRKRGLWLAVPSRSSFLDRKRLRSRIPRSSTRC
jgi:hypothetical protein